MSGDDLATALTSGGATWLVLSLAAVLPILWAFVLTLHFARPYLIIRFLGGLTLRFGGDVWWLSYVLIRDGLMLVTLALGMVFLMPNLFIGLGLPITAPLTVGLFWALVLKLTRDTDDDPVAFRWVSVILFVSSILYIVPQVYGLEAADQLDAWKGVGLDWLPGALTAAAEDGTVNGLTWPIYWLALGLFALTGAYLFTRFFRRLPGSDAEVGVESPGSSAG